MIEFTMRMQNGILKSAKKWFSEASLGELMAVLRRPIEGIGEPPIAALERKRTWGAFPMGSWFRGVQFSYYRPCGNEWKDSKLSPRRTRRTDIEKHDWLYSGEEVLLGRAASFLLRKG